ncbi:unnamed protein product [Penicillium nalgiovense]|nr:unnamed protein product [Penicillium nalgiovense]
MQICTHWSSIIPYSDIWRSCLFTHSLDIHSANLLACMNDSENAKFKGIEDSKMTSPSARKPVSSDRTIYISRAILPKEGPLRLSDFGGARIGPGPYDYPAMPMPYRAPEIVLQVPWSYPIGIWCVGLTACDLLGLDSLFSADHTAGDMYEPAHLTELMLYWVRRLLRFWRSILRRRLGSGMKMRVKWVCLPFAFVKFMRRTLTWMPDERATAKDLLEGPWLKD